MVAIILAAIFAPAVLIYHIFKRDKYQPEPTGELLKGFGLGVVSVIIALIIASPLDLLSPLFHSAIYRAFFIAALPEETAKLLCLWFLLRKNKYFDEYMDGIVYAVAIGMGFSATENIMYLLVSDHWVRVAVLRSLISVPGHFADAVIMGYYYSLWSINKDSSSKLKMLLMPVLAHGIFDVILMSMELHPKSSLLLIITFCYFLIKLRKHCSMLIKEHLETDKLETDKDETDSLETDNQVSDDDVISE